MMLAIKYIRFAKFKNHLKIAVYHQWLRHFCYQCKLLADMPVVFWQLDNDGIVELSKAVAPQNFFRISGYTFIFFGGIVSIYLLPSSTKMMANGP